MPPYCDPKYWEERYIQQPVAFDWYQGYAGLRQIIVKHAPPATTSCALQIGVGTSVLQESMVRDDGYRSITNIDISATVIEHMKELHKGVPELSYKVVDCTDMEVFKNDTFDAIIDKGTLDALMCEEGCHTQVFQVLKECFRVLKPYGTMILITYGDPSTRLHYLGGDSGLVWEVEVYVVSKVVEGTQGAETTGPTIIRGPYKSDNLDAMDALSELDSAHFAYCMKKVAA